ncbi:MAG: hypothetical protein WEE89_19780 [Gemmatimonadota bacterium]
MAEITSFVATEFARFAAHTPLTANVLRAIPSLKAFASMAFWVNLIACDSSRERTVLRSDPDGGCPNCVIQLKPLARLGSPFDSVSPVYESEAVRAADSTFWVAPTDHPGLLAAYSAVGSFIRTAGVRGTGPGEFSDWLKVALTSGDTVSVIDIAQARRTLIDTEGRAIRIHPLPAATRGLASSQRRLFAQADIRSPELIGKPIHELNAQGDIIASFGDVGIYRQHELDGVRPIGPARDGGLWAAVPNRYEILHFDSALSRIDTIRVDVRWFPPNQWMGNFLAEPPEPRIVSIRESEDGLVWLIIRVKDINWQADDTQRERLITMDLLQRAFDWRIEVVDPIAKRRLGGQQYDEMLFSGVGDGLIYARFEGEDGRVYLTAYKSSFQKGR